MNADRRKEITAAIELADTIRDLLDEFRSKIEDIRDGEQEYLDNMPESFQNGEKGEKAQAAIDAATEAFDLIEEIDLEAITDLLNTAAE